MARQIIISKTGKTTVTRAPESGLTPVLGDDGKVTMVRNPSKAQLEQTATLLTSMQSNSKTALEAATAAKAEAASKASLSEAKVAAEDSVNGMFVVDYSSKDYVIDKFTFFYDEDEHGFIINPCIKTKGSVSGTQSGMCLSMGYALQSDVEELEQTIAALEQRVKNLESFHNKIEKA